MIHSDLYLDLRHDFFRLCVFIAGNALIANFLPKSTVFKGMPRTRWTYELLVDLIAGFGLSWRAKRPSLQKEWMGFKVRRRSRRWIVEFRSAPDLEVGKIEK